MSKPIEAIESIEAVEPEIANDARSLEGTKGYNYISPESKEMSMEKLFAKNPKKWEYVLK